jgi:hypothetical protein
MTVKKKQQVKKSNPNERVRSAGKVVEACIKEYGEYVLQERALADLRDGLKPVQRRILWAMWDRLKVRPSSTPKKCARVTGETTGCFVGSTNIPLLSGEVKTLQELVRDKKYRCRPFWVYAEINGRVVPGLAHSPRLTRKTKTLVEVTLDTGDSFRCTKDHLWKMFVGHYERADKLTTDAALMPFTRDVESEGPWEGYERVKHPWRGVLTKRYDLEKGAYDYTHRVVADYFSMLDVGEVVHHKDRDKRNNDPTNLEGVDPNDHARAHHQDQSWLSAIRKSAASPQSRERKSKALTTKHREAKSGLLSQLNADSDFQRKAYRGKILKLANRVLSAGDEICESTWEYHRGGKAGSVTLSKAIEEFGSQNELESRARNYSNHTVASIRIVKLKKAVPVYDLTVEEAHNFAIVGPSGQGVFVHNCFHPHGDCLSGKTRLYGLDGRTHRLDKLVESGRKSLWVLSINDKGSLVPAKAHTFRVGQVTSKVYSVTLSDGSKVRCTSNHPFLVRGLGWVRAEDLCVGHPLVGGIIRHHEDTHPDIKLVGDQFPKWSSKIPQISQDTRYCLFVSSVRVQRVTPTPMYDFTVDTHENALIVTSRSKGQMTAVCVHNSAVYQTLVNMHWQNAPLLEGVGNFGDPPSKKPAAAARYTSVRSSSLLSEMFKDAPVTPMQPNYSAEFQEPTVIPTRVPNLLLNGTEGIAVGVTSNIPPHNLSELVDAALLVLKNPKTRLTTLLKRVKGPDYREGGRIVSKTEAIKELYDTGTGSLEFECLYTLTKVKGGYQLVVKSAAPTWSVSQFIDKCEKLVASNYITYVANESGEELRVVVFARQPNRLKDKVLPLLRKRVRYNWVALQDKKPLKLNLVTYLDRWLTWRQAVTKQHLEYQLKQLERQLLSEEAKLAAVRNLDATVKALRSSKPKLNLRKALNLTHPLQVRVILSSSLSLLTRLGEKNQAARVADLKKRVTAVKAQLKDVSGVVRQQLLDLKKSHGQARHTLV